MRELAKRHPFRTVWLVGYLVGVLGSSVHTAVNAMDLSSVGKMAVYMLALMGFLLAFDMILHAIFGRSVWKERLPAKPAS